MPKTSFTLPACIIAIVGCSVGCAASSTADDDGQASSAGDQGGNPTTSSAGGGTISGGDAGGFGGMGGAAPMCSEDPCKLTSPQCGCADGEMCTLRMGERTCGPAGTVQVGEPCGGTAKCAPGALCLGLGSDFEGLCRAFCDDDNDCGGGQGAGCALNVDSDSVIAQDRVCSEACHLVTNAGCPAAGTKCVAITTSRTACGVAGVGALGDPCQDQYGCGVGLGCVPSPNQMNTNECMQITTAANPQCPQGSTMESTGVVIGSVTYLVCVPEG